MNILAIGAHPDDIEYSCYGFLKKRAGCGDDIFLVVMSKGEKGGLGSERCIEQNNAFENSNFKKLIFKDFDDGNIICNTETISCIEAIIEEVKPDIVLTHYPEDSHQDHREVARVVITASRNCKTLLFYQSYSALNFLPEIYDVIDGQIEDKIKTLNFFCSQITKNLERKIDFVECAVATNRYHGVRCSAEYAEAFRVYRMILE